MHVLRFSCLLSVAAVFGTFYMIPDATRKFDDFTRFVKYSSGMVAFISVMGALWTGSIFSSKHIESWRMHLVKVRPVSTLQTVLGQIGGVFLCYVISFIVGIVTISAVSYYSVKQLSGKDANRIKTKFLYTREEIPAIKPDFSAQAVKMVNQKIQEGGLPEGYSFQDLQKQYAEQLEVRAGELLPANVIGFSYFGINPSEAIFLEFAPTITDSAEKDFEKPATGAFYFRNEENGYFYPQVVHFKSEQTTRTRVNPAFISDSKLYIEFENRDEDRRLIYFSPQRRPKIVIVRDNFFTNMLSATSFSIVVIYFFATLGVTLGMLFSAPVAMFFCFVYIFLTLLSDLQLLKGFLSDLMNTILISPFYNDALIFISEGRFLSSSFMLKNTSTAIGLTAILIVFTFSLFKHRELALIFRKS